MKKINIRFNNYLVNWILSNSQQNNVSISEFVRGIIDQRMANNISLGSDLKNYRNKSTTIKDHSRTEIGYIIFTAKLLENYILSTQSQGEELRKLAFDETEFLLLDLKLNKTQNNNQQVCISLEEVSYTWLEQEAYKLNLKVVTLLRRIIEEKSSKDPATINLPIELQKISIKYLLIISNLLEKLINITVEDSENMIKQAHDKAKTIISNL